jgi:hypothetical protein
MFVGDVSRVGDIFYSPLDVNSGPCNENSQMRFSHLTQRFNSKNQGSFQFWYVLYNDTAVPIIIIITDKVTKHYWFTNDFPGQLAGKKNFGWELAGAAVLIKDKE